MPTTDISQASQQGALTLAEIDILRSEICNLKLENTKLMTENELLKKQLHDLTSPAKKADAAAFKSRRRS